MTPTSPLSAPLALLSLATGITVNLNLAALATILAAVVAAYPSYRLLAANRRKVLQEAGAIADSRANSVLKDAADLFRQDNVALRVEMGELRGRLDAAEHRVDELERCLIEHGLPLP